jgi:AraC-like DNA-binding protein
MRRLHLRQLTFSCWSRSAGKCHEPTFRELRLAGLAFEAGYIDQAHLTREARRLSGFSPATVLRQPGA